MTAIDDIHNEFNTEEVDTGAAKADAMEAEILTTTQGPEIEDHTIINNNSNLNDPVPSTSNFCVNTSVIKQADIDTQEEELLAMGLSVYDQTELEEGILKQVDDAFKKEEDEKQRKLAEKSLESVNFDIKTVRIRLKAIEKILSTVTVASLTTNLAKRQHEAILREKINKEKQLKSLEAKRRALTIRSVGLVDIPNNSDLDLQAELDPETQWQLEQVFGFGVSKNKETNEEKLIRTGQMTPFGTVTKNKAVTPKILKSPTELTDFERYLLNQDSQSKKKQKVKQATNVDLAQPSTSKINEKTSTEEKSSPKKSSGLEKKLSVSKLPPLLPPKKVKRRRKEDVGCWIEGEKQPRKKRFVPIDPDSKMIDLDEFDNKRNSSGSEYIPSGSDYEDEVPKRGKKRKILSKKEKIELGKEDESSSESDGGSRRKKKSVVNKKSKIIDDGNQNSYLKRLRLWKYEKLLEDKDDSGDEFDEFEGRFRIPSEIYNKLYKYQQTCVNWLWELHSQSCGGIIGDEMGLGKTIQIIAFLVGLKHSDVVFEKGDFTGLGPVIIVTPTTVMHQWVREFHTWWPPFRVAILHESGSHSGTKESLIRNINACNGILITSYSGIVNNKVELLRYNWHYIILDEGHKIRNPDAQATLTCKMFRTPHRLILSGSPVQNNLKELWSLFDFVFPGKLGTLPTFLQQFSVPITQGGYANASQIQVQTAYKCAVVLRNTINPYLLRRMKADVKMNIELPNRNEQVLFCKLTEDQRQHYKEYLASKDIKSILDGKLQVFVGLTNLRKICNHSDLYSGGPKFFGNVDTSKLSEDQHYGYWKRSGKMLVVENILKMWYRQGHRVLLFSQSKQMLDILERFIQLHNYTYYRMDGSTSISSRQPLIQKFNEDPSIFIFLLTTRVGGLGVNLVGANRVIIFDPDWNPSTDMQARERAWRIGQKRHVTIYRLLCAGTIEEKIYHRQIFKQFLTNRVLKDPRQRRFFKSNDLFELFTLQDETSQGTETCAIFAGTGSEVKISAIKSDKSAGSCLSSDQIQKMKELAKRLSQKLSEKGPSNNKVSDDGIVHVKPNIKNNKDTPSTSNGKFKKKKKESKRNNKRKSKKLEKEKIEYLMKSEVYKPTQNDEAEAHQNSKQDEYVLQRLFSKTGVNSALKQDHIEGSTNPDFALVEGEAERVAREAVKALKQSRKQCLRAATGVPTWTGTNGLSGAPRRLRFGQKTKSTVPGSSEKKSPEKSEEKKLFNGENTGNSVETAESSVTSTDLLSIIHKRNQGIINYEINDENEDNVSAMPRLETKYDELLTDLRNYIAFQSTRGDGEASTEELVAHFRNRLPPQDSAVFKALLNKICCFQRMSGIGFWKLLPEFS